MNYDVTILNQIKNALENSFIFIDNDDIETIDFSDYIRNSLQFMGFVVELEEVFSIEFPPELLLIKNFMTIERLYPIIMELKNEKTK